MKNKLKIFIIILVICISCISFTGCFDSKEIDDYAYVMAIGIDKGKTNKLKFTFQFALPSPEGGSQNTSSKSKESESKEKSSSEENTKGIMSVEANDIFSALTIVNTCISKEINVADTKAIIVSDDIAKQNYIHQLIHSILRFRQFRPTMFLAISLGPAEEFIKSVKPELELNIAKYYELLFMSNKYSGFIENVRINDFYNTLESVNIQPVAPLVSISKSDISRNSKPSPSDTNKEKPQFLLSGNYKAGNIPEERDTKSESMGLAVFKNNSMIGSLTGTETCYHKLISNSFDYSFFDIPDPKQPDKIVVLRLQLARPTKIHVDIHHKIPRIDIKLVFEGDIISIESNYNYEDPKKSAILEKATEEFFKKGIQTFLQKTSREFSADICGFGEHIKKNFLTWDDFKKFDWKNRYPSSKFNISVDVKIRRPGLLIRSIDIKGDD